MGQRLSSVRFGKAENEAVVFLHGFMGSGQDWTGVAAQVAGRRCVICPDLPGHGASVRMTPDAYTFDGIVSLLEAMLDEAGIAVATFVGYSMGGRIAIHFAMERPDRVNALLLESASPGLATSEERRLRRQHEALLLRSLAGSGVSAFVVEWYRQPLFASLAGNEALRQAMVLSRAQNDASELARALTGFSISVQPCYWDRLRELNMFATLVVGGLDKKYRLFGERMRALAPAIRIVVVPEAGHNVHAERPEAYLAALNNFLNRD